MSDVPVFEAENLNVPHVSHGFFGRRGGVSTGVYSSLNTGCGSADRAALISTNRSRIANAMGVGTEHLIGVYQVHSARAVHVDRPWLSGAPKADALVSTMPGLALSVLSADCAPVLFAEPTAGVIGAAHAGWRGALDGILEATVKAMQDAGAKASDICAAIGPSIASVSYEVGPEFLETFVKTDPRNETFFVQGKADRWHFDLPAFCAKRLHNAGVRMVETLPCDTCTQERDFFSYRRATSRGESDYGRNISVIALHPK